MLPPFTFRRVAGQNYDQAVMAAGKGDRNSSTKSCTAQALNKMVRFQRSAVSVANSWNKLTWWHCPDSFADPALVPKTAMTHDVRLVFLMHFFSGLMKEDGMPPDTSTFKTWVVSTYRLMKWRQQDFIAAYCIPPSVFIAVKLSESDVRYSPRAAESTCLTTLSPSAKTFCRTW
ncbi:hypothetical protein M885DRAFT_113216 [Pelagophyceae sp. CCMP2097]|nr:hypothetical protein M885DRAFT_113216 [Pelagophyceae sp. CCMP2097]